MAQLAPFDADNDCPSKFALRKTSAHDHDGIGLFNLAIYCSMFHGKTVQIDPVTYVPSIDVDLWRSALQARNQYTAHLPNLSVPEDEFLRGIIAFDRLLGDAALCVGPWAAHALEARQCIRYVTTLSELELSRSLIKDISNHRSLTAFRVQRQVKTLTAQQCKSFLRFRDALLRKQQRPGRPFLPPRLLVQAPSGSGKTVISAVVVPSLRNLFHGDAVSPDVREGREKHEQNNEGDLGNFDSGTASRRRWAELL
eukprot:m.64729 g.64729  ORF g.64729 m.64729 type:complete len:254 (+) comp9729_c0_seq2:1279-2040(+)